MPRFESKPNWAIVALAVGAFGIGATEFSPMGLLPTIATGLGVSIPIAGLLVSAYALGVMLGAPVMTLVLGRIPRKTALILLMLIFSVGNLLAAASTNYAALLAARVFTSLAHGAFFGLGSVVASALVPPEKAASAVAGMFMGLTIANIGGVPAATWIGQQIGWRAAFAAIAVLGVAAMGSLAVALPSISMGDSRIFAASWPPYLSRPCCSPWRRRSWAPGRCSRCLPTSPQCLAKSPAQRQNSPPRCWC
jgi:DHA1 family inner membrane transport protein